MEPTYNTRTELKCWGEYKQFPPLSRAELASRRTDAFTAFRVGAHTPAPRRRVLGRYWTTASSPSGHFRARGRH